MTQANRLILPHQDDRPGISDDQYRAAWAQKDTNLWKMDKADAEEKLIDFVSQTWHLVEPLRPFMRTWVAEAICEHLEALHRGEIRKLVINVPPGFAKSLLCSVFFPAWEWGPRNQAGLRYLCTSYSQDLTVRDNVRTRIILQSAQYQSKWGDRFQLEGDQNAKQKFANTKMGWKLATSVKGVGTGERGDRVVMDDPHSVKQAESEAERNNTLQWFTETMPTRINDMRTAGIIVIMQRVHEQDVTGLIFEKELNYTRLVIPMHYDPNHPHLSKKHSWPGWSGDPRTVDGELADPVRVPEDLLNEQIKEMMSWGGSYAVAGQMEQRPEPRGGGMVQADWFDIVDYGPDGFVEYCRGWDFASTEGGEGAESACVLMGETTHEGQTELWICHAWSDRVSPGGLYDMIRAIVRVDGWRVFQSLPKDPGQAGVYQVDDLLELFEGIDFQFSSESGDKVARFRPFAAQAETRATVGRKIKIVKGEWNAKWLEQICKFPVGRLKDLADGTSRSYGGLVRNGGGSFQHVGGSTLVLPNGANRGHLGTGDVTSGAGLTQEQIRAIGRARRADDE